ncbi:MAG: MFS transporter [Chloroflexia bacterium]|nr:MFS transporter [Chloroflexia bacterium]
MAATAGVQNPSRRNRRPLFALLGADGISQTGNTLAMVAIPWYVLETTGSAALTGVTAAAETVAIVISGVLGGVIVDRLGQKRTSIIGDLASAATIALIPLLDQTVGLAYWQLLVLVFLGAVLDTPGRTARRGLYATVARLGAVGLERTNTSALTVNRAAGLAGPLLAGVLIAALGPTPVLWIDAATFLVSAGLVAAGIPGRIVPRPVGTVGTVDGAAMAGIRPAIGRYLEDVREGFRFIGGDRVIGTLLVVFSLGSLLAEPMWSVVFPVYADQVFGSALDLGIIFGALAAGSLLGNAVSFVWGPRLPRRATLIAGFTVRVLTLWVIVAMPPLWVIVVAVVVNALFLEPTNPIWMTVFHERIPEALYGRVLGALLSLIYAARTLGVVVYGLLLEWAGLRPTLVVLAVVNVVVPLVLWLTPALRGLDASRATGGADGTGERHPRAAALAEGELG